MKKVKYFIFVLALFLCFNTNVFAKLCVYKGGGMNATFTVNDTSYELTKKAKIWGGIDNTSDKSNKDGINESQEVENWSSTHHSKIAFIGKNYYAKEEQCPEYAILIDRICQFDLVVSDKEHLEEFLKFASSKQGYAQMTLQIEAQEEEMRPVSCLGLGESYCKTNYTFSCVWNEKNVGGNNYEYCNVDDLLFVHCGNTRDIPIQVPSLISFFVNLLKIATPIILTFISLITLLKAVAASKEDEIKKAQISLVKKIIAAALVFFIVSIVQFVISKVALTDAESEGFSSCLDCFLNNSCESTAYYITNVSGEYWCTELSTGKSDICNYK